VAALANLVIAIATLSQGLKRPVVRVFFFLSLCLVSWHLDILALYYFTDAPAAEFWSRIFRTGLIFAPPAAYHLTILLGPAPRRGTMALRALGYAIATAMAALNLSGVLVAGVEPHYWGWYVRPTPLYGALTGFLLLYLALSFEGMWFAYRHPVSPRARVQAKLWFLSAGLAIPFAVTNLATVYGIHIYPLGNLGNVMYAGVIAYAISRHRLMDVDYVVRKFVSFILALSAVLVPGGILLFRLAVYLGAEKPSIVVMASVTLALVGVILVPTLQEALETRVQRAFFPRRYDYRQRLRRFASELVHVLDEAALIKQLGDTFVEVLDVEYCRIYLGDSAGQFAEVYPTRSPDAALPESLSRPLQRIEEPMLVGELNRFDEALEARLLAESAEVVLPLRIEDRVIGIILLARNRDFLLFSGEDLQVLANVAAGASVALENSRLSRELRKSEAVLARANRLSSIGMLAAGIAHEIRNPLTAVKTFLDLLPQRIDDRDFVDQFRDLSLSELKRVTDLINDMLTLGRSTTSHRTEVDLAEAIEPLARLLENTARKGQVEVAVEADGEVPSVFADPDQLKQIALNLLLNAIDVSPPQSRVLVHLFNTPDGPTFEVRDHGSGIAADELDNIFEPFFTTKESGTGLGLALVHQMVVEHGGTITVESRMGEGTTFRVTLPPAPSAMRRSA
jgi:signal transduction histidine kinase